MKKRLSIIIPVFNEESCLEELWSRLCQLERVLDSYELEYIFVNDGSSDNSLAMLRALAEGNNSVKVISFSRNFGHEIAITAGCDFATGDGIVFIDADLQDPPELIPDMLKKYEEGYDVVYAVRRSRSGESLFKKETAKWFYSLINWMSYIKIPQETSNFRLINRRVLSAFSSLRERDRFIRGMISWLGFKQTGIEFDRGPRFAGSTKYSLKVMVNFALDGIISFSRIPLRLSLWFGAFSVAFSFILLLIGLLTSQKVFSLFNTPMLFGIIFFFGGIQLLSIGIVGEYISRIYNEAIARPLYIINETINIQDRWEEKQR